MSDIPVPDLNEIVAAIERATAEASAWHASDDTPHWEFRSGLASGAAEMVLDDGRRIQRHLDWIELPVDARAAFYGAIRLFRDLSKRGRGRVHFVGLPVHVINDDGMWCWADGLDGGPVIRLRTIAYVEGVAP